MLYYYLQVLTQSSSRETFPFFQLMARREEEELPELLHLHQRQDHLRSPPERRGGFHQHHHRCCRPR